jgi:DNA sulfur modification protein DndB
MEKLFIPALRGVFGDWIYYSCLVPATIVAERISFANELHKNKNLSDLIQREIKTRRGAEIAHYLETEKERFFNSLVVAVYNGQPEWYEFDIKSQSKEVSVDDIPSNAVHSFGFIHLVGPEKLFALDGQHRLAGLKKVLTEGKKLDDEISVILVGHKNTVKGLQRTRRLFTTLNKTAIPVSKGEKIALDENDVMAIVVRRMVEQNRKFEGDRIAYKTTNNLTAKDDQSLTTIGNLYDVLGILFARIMKKAKLRDLQYSRPDDATLEDYYTSAVEFFELLEDNIPELKAYFKASKFGEVVGDNRGSFGGSVLFRPLGLAIYAEAIAELSRTRSLNESIRLIAKIPRNLSAKPFADILWDRKRRVILPTGRVLARNLILYMLGDNRGVDKLQRDYARALGKDVSKVQLPQPL